MGLPVSAVPTLAVRMTGSITNAEGMHLNVISVTNLSPTTILAYMPRVLVKDDSVPVATAGWKAELKPGEASVLTIGAPPKAEPWKLHLYVYNDLDMARRVERFVFRRRYHPHFMESGWMDSATTNVEVQMTRR